MQDLSGPGAAPTALPTLTVHAGSQTRGRLGLTLAAALLGVLVLGLAGALLVPSLLLAASVSSGSSPDTPSGLWAGWSLSAPSPAASRDRSSTSDSPWSSPGGAQLRAATAPSSFAGWVSWTRPQDIDPTTSPSSDVGTPAPEAPAPAPETVSPTPTPTPLPGDPEPVTGSETRQFYVAVVIALGLLVCLVAVHTVSSWGRTE